MGNVTKHELIYAMNVYVCARACVCNEYMCICNYRGNTYVEFTIYSKNQLDLHLSKKLHPFKFGLGKKDFLFF